MTPEQSSPVSDQPLEVSQAAVVNLSEPPGKADEPQPSYIKLAMRNMVKKRHISLFHFGLTTIGLLGVLVGLAYLTR